MKRLVILLLALAALPAFAKDEFHLYNWNNYVAQETVKRFEEFCKCTVVQTYYSDNEELLAKLAAGAKGYDMLVPTSNAVQALIKGGQLKPIDKAQLPNLKNIEPAYLNTPFDPDNKVLGAVRDVDDDHRLQRCQDQGARPAHRYVGGGLRSEVPGKDQGPRHGAGQRQRAVRRRAQVSRLLGQRRRSQHWEEAAALIKKAKPYWAGVQRVVVHQGAHRRQHLAGARLLHDIFQANLDAQAAGRKFNIVQGMPKEGAVLAVDNMVIPKSAPRPDLALKFTNFMLEGKNSAELTNLIGSGNPNLEATKYIKPELLKMPAIFPDKAVATKLEQLKDLTAAQRRLRNRMWTEIKAGR